MWRMMMKSAHGPWNSRRFSRIDCSRSVTHDDSFLNVELLDCCGELASIKYWHCGACILGPSIGHLTLLSPKTRYNRTHFYIAAAPLAAGFLSYPLNGSGLGVGRRE